MSAIFHRLVAFGFAILQFQILVGIIMITFPIKNMKIRLDNLQVQNPPDSTPESRQFINTPTDYHIYSTLDYKGSPYPWNLTDTVSSGLITLNPGNDYDLVINLPPPEKGVHFRFVFVGPDGNKAAIIHSPKYITYGVILSGGTIVGCNTKTDVAFTRTCNYGDSAQYFSDGANWYLEALTQRYCMTCT